MRRRHRRSVRFIIFPPNKNAPAPTMGTRTENTFSAVPPCLPVSRPLCTVPTHRLPLTQAIRQQILRIAPFPSALGGPFAAPLFAPLSAAGTLCGCAAQFYFRFVGFLIVTLFNYTFVSLSRTFFRVLWKRLRIRPGCGKIKSNFSLSLRLLPHLKGSPV